MYISTSYYRVLVQELRVFRPQNAPNSVPCNLSATAHNWWNLGWTTAPSNREGAVVRVSTKHTKAHVSNSSHS